MAGARCRTDRGRGGLLESLARSTSTPPWYGAGLAPACAVAGRVLPRRGYAMGAGAGGRGQTRDRSRSWSGVGSVPFVWRSELSPFLAIRSEAS
jgi:hypothetical protein